LILVLRPKQPHIHRVQVGSLSPAPHPTISAYWCQHPLCNSKSSDGVVGIGTAIALRQLPMESSPLTRSHRVVYRPHFRRFSGPINLTHIYWMSILSVSSRRFVLLTDRSMSLLVGCLALLRAVVDGFALRAALQGR